MPSSSVVTSMPSARRTRGLEGVAGEVGVGEDDLVAMAHFGQGFEQIGAEAGVDSFEHEARFRFGIRRGQFLVEADGDLAALAGGHEGIGFGDLLQRKAVRDEIGRDAGSSAPGARPVPSSARWK